MVKAVACIGCLLVLLIIVVYVVGTSMSRQERSTCEKIPVTMLEKILGGAFNSRYMSITPPLDRGPVFEDSSKRGASPLPSFYVDNDYFNEFGDFPAWDYSSHRYLMMMEGSYRIKRGTRGKEKEKKQWECDSDVVWSDLGPDYFPRYIRNIECVAHQCWYGMYFCKPRSFTVKVLKLRRGRCALTSPGATVGFSELHNNTLKELWVWEERAVNFCCDCSL